MTNPPPPEGDYPPPPPQGNYPPPPPQGGYGTPPPPPQGNYPPPPPQGGYGAPPPPPGNYPPPPPGNYPPPPQGNYPPPPPPQGGYAPPPPGSYPPPQGDWGQPQGGYPPQGAYGGYPPASNSGVDIGETFGWAWNKFSKNAVVLIVPTLVYAVVLGILVTVVSLLFITALPDSVSTYDSYDGGVTASFSSGLSFGSLVVGFLGAVVTFVVIGAMSSAYYAGVLEIADGRSVTFGSFFKPRNVGSVLLASMLIGVVSSVLSFCFIFSFVISLLTLFVTVIIVDRGVPPIAAIKASFDIVKNNFGSALLAWLIVLATVAIGAAVFGIGLLVAAPVAALFLVHAYRKLTGGQVAPLTP